jgi:hypothetical protein
VRAAAVSRQFLVHRAEVPREVDSTDAPAVGHTTA